jgi:hypothetical protein
MVYDAGGWGHPPHQFNEPEILRYENLRSVPQALTSDNRYVVHSRYGVSSIAERDSPKEWRRRFDLEGFNDTL